jgi:hypothetical protein
MIRFLIIAAIAALVLVSCSRNSKTSKDVTVAVVMLDQTSLLLQ